MNKFVSSIATQEARTENGMKALKASGNACVDLFYAIGASRNTNIIPKFVAAYVENKQLATRIALWARDARGGAGERQVFRDIISYISENDQELANRVANKIPELGRWDDLFSLKGDSRQYGFGLIKAGLEQENNALVAKWMPRRGIDAVNLRKFLGMSPKQYRKTLVNATKVVETDMCSKQWGKINYNHVPSVASARYQKAFFKHDSERYSKWKNDLKTGASKVNASVLYPYEVIRSIRHGDEQVALAQWEALPNYIAEGKNILPVVDVSGSMTCPASGNITCLDVALSLGLYLADKNHGDFKDVFVTFSRNPELMQLKGDLLQKMKQMEKSKWEMSTNLHAVFDLVVDLAIKNQIPQDDMPNTILILSDMQFDSCTRFDDSAIEMIRRKYNKANYIVPNVVFWNLNAVYKNTPVQFKEGGVAMVSGFSPSLMKNILGDGNLNPEKIMFDVVNNPRYNF